MCETCPRTFEDLEPPADMSWSLFTKIVDQVPDVARVLVPVDHSPPPGSALDMVREFIRRMSGEGTAIELMHVGENGPPKIADGTIVPVVPRKGDVVETILKAAQEQEVDLIAMPTAGHRGFLDAMRGSTTERVMAKSITKAIITIRPSTTGRCDLRLSWRLRKEAV